MSPEAVLLGVCGLMLAFICYLAPHPVIIAVMVLTWLGLLYLGTA